MTQDELEKLGIDPTQIPESHWQTSRVDPEGVWREDIAWIVKPHGNEPGVSIKRKVNLHETALLEANRKAYDTDQKFTRKGSELDAQVASVPLNVLYNDELLLDAVRGDRDKMKHWLNDDENRIYRTIKGKI